ncbi:hypothetical protein [Pontibacter sp. HSC-14F20]|nr:hypothetical protein [Pontibacter sp. HSC-14F20]
MRKRKQYRTALNEFDGSWFDTAIQGIVIRILGLLLAQRLIKA